jgi:hypothetical protein
LVEVRDRWDYLVSHFSLSVWRITPRSWPLIISSAEQGAPVRPLGAAGQNPIIRHLHDDPPDA